MMNRDTLRARLREVVQPGTQSRPATEPPAVQAPTLESVPAGLARRADHGIESALGGAWRDGVRGRSFVVTRRYAPDAMYGRLRVDGIHQQFERAASSARLFGAPTAAAPFVFFDLETTGLSGGAGTYAFLVGCGRFDADGGFVTEQYLMADYASERAMLEAVAADLAKAGALVTFNGKSFDAPLVETRYLFHRSTSPCAALPHIDVLHPSRRFWSGASIEGCSLTTLEQKILGARREGDVSGFEIPARYFQFVRTGDARPLADVFEHNRLDLLSLAGLTGHVFAMVEAGAASARTAQESFGLGRIYERAGLSWRAEEAFERAIALCGSGIAARQIKAEALRALALEARRARRYEMAAERWQQLVQLPGCPALLAREAAEALAIHHEHRVRDLEAAKHFALQSLALKNVEGNRGVAWGDAVRHRLARIERKMTTERRPLFSWPSPPASAAPTSASRTSS